MMNKALKIFLILVCTFSFLPSVAQILDDSTELVYGPYTTFYTTFDRIKNNDFRLTKIDTLIKGIHNFDFVSQSDYKYQDLGVIGTATKPVFYQPPENIGVRTGFYVYEPYYIEKEDIKFYDTKSPYTLIEANFGGGRRATTEISHARNINPYWNAGVYFRRMSIEKQVSSSGRNDRQTISTSYYFHTHYQSKSQKYTGLLVASRVNHEVQESGGVDSTNFFSDAQYFDRDASVYLENAESSTLQLNFFTYHQYRWKRQLQFYYLWEQKGTKYFFTDHSLRSESDFFDQVLINPDSTTDKARFRESIHEPGIKGSQGDFYYNVYTKLRKVNYLHQYLPYDENELENYYGFNLRYDFDSLKNHSLNAKGEYKIGKGYFLRALYTNKFFTAVYQKSRYEPAIIHENYFGNHDEWHNSFDPVNSDYLKGQIELDLGSIRIAPSLSLMNIYNNIYFDRNGEPAQADGNAQILSPGLELDFHFFNKAMHFENEVIYTRITGESEAADAFRIPELFINSSLYFGKPVFDRKINVNAGLQFHMKTDYYPKAYDPAMRQFYLQDSFVVPAYLIVDAFIDFRIDHVAVFLRYENLTQQTNEGYFTFPNYVGQRKVFDLGVSWMFFD